MKRIYLGTLALAGLIGGGIYWEHRAYLALVDRSINSCDPRRVAMHAAPIQREWILEGHPDAEVGKIGQTHDGMTAFFVWRVKAGRFNWHYDVDETVQITDGDVYLTNAADAVAGNPEERHLKQGDVVFFRNGANATWRVPDHLSKLATVRYPLPEPVASLHRWLHALKTMVQPQTASIF